MGTASIFSARQIGGKLRADTDRQFHTLDYRSICLLDDHDIIRYSLWQQLHTCHFYPERWRDRPYDTSATRIERQGSV